MSLVRIQKRVEHSVVNTRGAVKQECFVTVLTCTLAVKPILFGTKIDYTSPTRPEQTMDRLQILQHIAQWAQKDRTPTDYYLKKRIRINTRSEINCFELHKQRMLADDVSCYINRILAVINAIGLESVIKQEPQMATRTTADI